MRTIYVNPGELLDIRVIRDEDEALNNKSFEFQPNCFRRKLFVKVKSHDHIAITDPAVRVDYETIGGKLIATR